MGGCGAGRRAGAPQVGGADAGAAGRRGAAHRRSVPVAVLKRGAARGRRARRPRPAALAAARAAAALPVARAGKGARVGLDLVARAAAPPGFTRPAPAPVGLPAGWCARCGGQLLADELVRRLVAYHAQPNQQKAGGEWYKPSTSSTTTATGADLLHDFFRRAQARLRENLRWRVVHHCDSGCRRPAHWQMANNGHAVSPQNRQSVGYCAFR